MGREKNKEELELSVMEYGKEKGNCILGSSKRIISSKEFKVRSTEEYCTSIQQEVRT